MEDDGKQVYQQSRRNVYLSEGARNAKSLIWRLSDSSAAHLTPVTKQIDPKSDDTKILNRRDVLLKFKNPRDQERNSRVNHPNVPNDPPCETLKKISESLGGFNRNYERPKTDDLPKHIPNFELFEQKRRIFNAHFGGIRIKGKREQNTHKYMELLACTENFYAGEWKRSDMAAICDGVVPAGITCYTLDAAEYAVSFLKKQREEDDEIKLKELIRGNWQYRGCHVYWLTMEASDDKFYEAIVLVSIDRKERELKYIRPAKYYPEIPADLHHLIGPAPGEERLPDIPFIPPGFTFANF